jgi:hypothetical protein
MRRLISLSALALGLSVVPSCKDDPDYARIMLQSSDPRVGASLKLQILLSGGGRASQFSYTTDLSRPPPDLSDFTLTFDPTSPREVDVRAITRPSAQAVDWGGDLHLVLPGAKKTYSLELYVGEQTLPPKIPSPADGDLDSIAPYGAQAAIAWPTKDDRVAAVPGNIDNDRLTGSIDRPPEFGTAVKKVRVTSRPSSSFTSEIFVTSWIEADSRPTLRSELRNLATTEPQTIDNLSGVTDFRVALDPSRTARLPVVSAVLVDNRVVVYGHDDTGALLTARIEIPALTSVTALVGAVVTPNETLSLVVTGNEDRLVQISLGNDDSLGTLVAEQTLSGVPVAMSTTADGSRILVATVTDAGDPEKGTLRLQAFSASNPTPTTPEPIKVAPFPFVIGDPASRVALSSCAVAWPQARADGLSAIDVWYSQLDFDQKPSPPHVAHVSQENSHWSPSIACFSATNIMATMLTGPNPRGDASLALRHLPTR